MVRFKLVEVPSAGDTADIAGRILQLPMSGRHDHGSRRCLRRGRYTIYGVCSKNHRPLDPPTRPQMRDRNDLLVLMLSIV